MDQWRMTVLPYGDRSYVRFISDRTRETMFEITMLQGSLIVWGATTVQASSRRRWPTTARGWPYQARCGIAWVTWSPSIKG
jgi:hypothetical protein